MFESVRNTSPIAFKQVEHLVLDNRTASTITAVLGVLPAMVFFPQGFPFPPKGYPPQAQKSNAMKWKACFTGSCYYDVISGRQCCCETASEAPWKWRHELYIWNSTLVSLDFGILHLGLYRLTWNSTYRLTLEFYTYYRLTLEFYTCYRLTLEFYTCYRLTLEFYTCYRLTLEFYTYYRLTLKCYTCIAWP